MEFIFKFFCFYSKSKSFISFILILFAFYFLYFPFSTLCPFLMLPQTSNPTAATIASEALFYTGL